MGQSGAGLLDALPEPRKVSRAQGGRLSLTRLATSSKHVLTEDVVQRRVDRNGCLLTKRLLSKTNPCPRWAERLISARSLFIIEESIVDPVRKTLVTYTRNIGCLNYMTIEEKVVYRPTGPNDNWTVAERMAWIDSKYGYGISRAVQAFGYDRFRKNVAKATKGFQFVLDSMYGPKILSTPPFASPSSAVHVGVAAGAALTV